MPDDQNDPKNPPQTDASDFELHPVGDITSSLLGDDVLDLGDALNAVLDKGAVIHGDVTIAVADIDLIKLSLGLLLHGVATAENRGRQGGSGTGPAAGAGPSGPPSGSLAGSLGSIMPDAPRPPGSAPATSAAPKPAPSAPPLSGPIRERTSSNEGSTTLNSVAHGLPERINADVQGVESGLARLVLTLIEVLRKVLEHQAVRRMEGGRLSAEEVERLGLALSRLHDRMGDLKRVFGLSDEDLQIDLGPLGRLR